MSDNTYKPAAVFGRGIRLTAPQSLDLLLKASTAKIPTNGIK